MAVLLALGGCGGTATPAAAPTAAKPDVIITFAGAQHACSVALASEAQGSSIPCSDVVAFVRDELRVPSGRMYEVRKVFPVDDTEMTRVVAGLNGAGYRPMGEPR